MEALQNNVSAVASVEHQHVHRLSDTLASDTAVALLLKTRYNYYELSDQPSKAPAHQIRRRASTQHIAEINVSSGISINPHTIKNQFRDFYSTSYISEYSWDEAQYESFFNSFAIPMTDPKTAFELDKCFTLAEVKSAILSHVKRDTIRQATISLILKKVKDPRICNNYRTISMLCTNFEVLAKILGKHLEVIMTKVINPDQTGFIKNIHSFII